MEEKFTIEEIRTWLKAHDNEFLTHVAINWLSTDNIKKANFDHEKEDMDMRIADTDFDGMEDFLYSPHSR